MRNHKPHPGQEAEQTDRKKHTGETAEMPCQKTAESGRKENNMKTVTIGEKEYQLEFTFEAAEHRGLIQSMFRILSGSYLVRRGIVEAQENEPEREGTAASMLDGVAEMISDMPHICRTAFYAGLLEHHRVPEDTAAQLMRQYMKEQNLTFMQLYKEIQKCMEDDGFFALSGLTGMLERMNAAAAQAGKTAQTGKTKKTVSRKSRTSAG